MAYKSALLCTLLITATPSWASDVPRYGPVPDWVKAAPPVETLGGQGDAPVFVILDHQQRISDGELWHYFEGATRMATPQIVAQAGTIQIPWSPDQGDLIVHSAQILRDGEKIDLLDGGRQLSVLRREQKLEQMQLDGLLTATMPVEGLRVGDILRLRFSITRRDGALNGQVQTSLPLFAEPLRVGFGRVRLVWSGDAKVHWRSYAGGAKPVPTSLPSGARALEVTLPIAKPVEVPADAPARFQPMSFLDASTYADWAAVSKAMAPLYATTGTIAPDSALAAEVAAIAAASTDPRQRAAAALQLVQDKVRYLFNGMAQGNYVPQSPAQTWSLRYGDCKAKSLLLLALLRELGVDAEAVLVHSKLGDVVPQRLPMPGVFDHVIVRARIGADTLWLDGTSSGDRIADLADTPPFRNVLPLRAAGADLLELPLRPRARPDVDADIMVDQRAGIHLPGLFTLKVTLRGQMVQMLRGAAAVMDKTQIDGMIASAARDYVTTETYTRRTLSFDDAAGTAVVLVEGVAYPDWVRDNERYKVTLDNAVQAIAFEPDRSRQAWRDLPVTTGEASHVRVRTSYRLPAGGVGFTVEGDQALPERLAGRMLERRTSVANGMVTVEDRTIVTGEEVAVADIGTARRDLAQAKTRLLRAVAPAAHPLRWQEVTAARKADLLQPLIAAYGQAIAADPDDADGYFNRSWLYERLFDVPAALRDIDRSIALLATPVSHLRRAELRAQLGQFDKAIADADAAVELDPGSAEAVQAAIRLRGEKGDYDAALALVDRQIDAGGKEKPGYLATKADLLAKSGDVDAGLAVLDAAVTTHPGNPALLNSRCWLKATYQRALDTALRDCTRAIELMENAAPALDSRAMVYFRMGRTDDALGDLDAALVAAPELTASLFLRGIIRKAKGHPGAEADLAAARMMDPRIDARYAKWNIKP